ncbi:MAG TPA: pyridoxal-phosphate dependent enzyme [Povalibacter sp.]|nr:pyridoxal-phosphate dependent enzyme [Povalibacter sp.]
MNDAIAPTDLWPDYRPTSLVELPGLARIAGVGQVFAKIEGERPLGSFKVLGGMRAGIRALARAAGAPVRDLLARRIAATALPRLICASDGNHGLSVAAAAARVGTKATIYLAVDVSQARAARIEATGAEVAWIDGTFDDAVDAASAAATRGEGLLIADTSSDPHDLVVSDVMAGYAVLAEELATQLRERSQRPSHLFVQAGVGGLAAALAEGLHATLREPTGCIVVEPAAAASVAHALATGSASRIAGAPHTCATMLSCGTASAVALPILRRHGARCVLVSEDELIAAVRVLQDNGQPTTPSGAAGLAGLLHVAARSDLRTAYWLDQHSTVLLVVTEGPVATL